MKTEAKLLIPEKVSGFVKRYRLAFLVIAAGGCLLLFSGGNKTGGVGEGEICSEEESFSVEALEKRLEDALSKISGAGDVTVVLTVSSEGERIFATDREVSVRDDEDQRREEIVTLSVDGGEKAILVSRTYPEFQGAVIICPGGGDPEVQLQLTRALSSLTGLGFSRIVVCKGT